MNPQRLMAYLMHSSVKMTYQWHALQDIKWLQMITRLPILVKGVITAEDGKYLVSVTSLNVMSVMLSYHPKYLQMCSSNCHWMWCCGYYHVQPRGTPARLSSFNHQLPRRGMLTNHRHGCTAALDILWLMLTYSGDENFRLSEKPKGVSLCSLTVASAVALTCSRPWHWEPQEYL